MLEKVGKSVKNKGHTEKFTHMNKQNWNNKKYVTSKLWEFTLYDYYKSTIIKYKF